MILKGDNFPASSKVLFTRNDFRKAYAYKNNTAAISFFNRKGIEDTAIFHKRSDGFIEYILMELKDGEKVAEGYAVLETLKEIDEYLRIDDKFERNSECDTDKYKECSYYYNNSVYYWKFIYKSKTFQEVYAETGKFYEGENIWKLHEKTTLKNINNMPVMYLYKDNIFAISYFVYGDIYTIILRKRNDGFIEVFSSEIVG